MSNVSESTYEEGEIKPYKDYNCDLCTETFSSVNSLVTHYKSIHEITVIVIIKHNANGEKST